MITPNYPGQCQHSWHSVASAVHDDDVRTYRQACSRCPATCRRDRQTGVITDYDAGVAYEDHSEPIHPYRTTHATAPVPARSTSCS